MLLKGTLIVLGLIFAVSACNLDRREKQLRVRERALARRQRQFASHETEYQALLLSRDSLLPQEKNSSPIYRSGIIEGIWRAKLICTKAGCGWVVGDQLWQNWDFTVNSRGLYVIVADRRRAPRVLTGTFSGKTINLTYLNRQLPERSLAISAHLMPSPYNTMQGERRIAIKGCCEAAFAVELSRSFLL